MKNLGFFFFLFCGVQAHALSCFDLEAPAWRPPTAAVRNQNILAAAEAIHKFLDREIVQTGLYPGIDEAAARILAIPQPALTPYFRDFVYQTQHDLLARGISEATRADFFMKWLKLADAGPSLGDIWDFTAASVQFARAQSVPWSQHNIPNLRTEYSLMMMQKKVFFIPLSHSVSFELRSRLFFLRTPPVTMQFRKRETASLLDRLVFSAKADWYHDLAHGELRFGVRSPPLELSKVERLFQWIEELQGHQKKIGFFIRDQLFSESRFTFDSFVSVASLRWQIQSIFDDFYLRSQYWVRFHWLSQEVLLPISNEKGEWLRETSTLVVHPLETSPRAGALVRLEEAFQDLAAQNLVVIDRRDGLLKELGLPTDMTWAELRSLINVTERELLRRIEAEIRW